MYHKHTPGCKETIKGIAVQGEDINTIGVDVDVTRPDGDKTVQSVTTTGRGKNGFLIELQNCQLMEEKML